MIKFVKEQVKRINPEGVYSIHQLMGIMGANYWTLRRWGESSIMPKIPKSAYPDTMNDSEKAMIRFKGSVVISCMIKRLIR